MKAKIKDVREIGYADAEEDIYKLRYDLRFNVDYVITVFKELPDSKSDSVKKARAEALSEINENLNHYSVKEFNHIEFNEGYVAPEFLKGV